MEAAMRTRLGRAETSGVAEGAALVSAMLMVPAPVSLGRSASAP
jgi:hypothetical protein